jgi:hypothetical protein
MKFIKQWAILFCQGCLLFCFINVNAQRTITTNRDNGGAGVVYDRQGRPLPNRGSGGKDSLQKRDRYADSITIYYKYFDSTASRFLDSGVNDFAKQFQQPYTYLNLGNYGTAARSLVFNPILHSGWDAGFHAFDLYAYTIENTRLFQTTRPYTELAYILGSKAEQTINLLHTQNKQSNFNFAFEYRFINSPGSFKNQNNNHNNLRFYANYITKNKRYGATLLFISNKHVSSENGGVRDAFLLDSLTFNNPFQLETRLGASGTFSQNPFNTNISTGNIYNNSTILLRQYYDIGKVDSVFNSNDSIYNKIFYARFRLQHTLQLKNYNYNFIDNNVIDSNYKKYFGLTIPNITTLSVMNKWNIINNELSVISFPQKNNAGQFIKLGAQLQNITGNLGISTLTNYNIALLAGYKNITRNKVWDIDAQATLYANGLNAGDYDAYISFKKILSKQLGSLQLGFRNVNRSPSALYTTQNAFFVIPQGSFKKENTTQIFGTYYNAALQLRLTGEYYLVNNYSYFNNFFTARQEATLFNVLHLGAEKKFKLAKNFNWYSEVHIQQTTANAPVNLPLLLTRNRIVFEGNFFTNLFLATGLELRYYTNHKAAGYSPFNGQFFYQDNFTLTNRPELNVFLQFRIKSFKAFTRLENMQTLIPGKGKYNFSTENYAMNALWFRLGIWWNFVN